ncbi:hypothetical protein ACVDG8_016210 [Mesorhizobium sp. ORM8.1]
MGSRKRIRIFLKQQKKRADFSTHDIVNDCIFLLISRILKSVRQTALAGVCLCLRTTPEAAEQRDFDGKSFPALPQGQGLHRRR